MGIPHPDPLPRFRKAMETKYAKEWGSNKEYFKSHCGFDGSFRLFDIGDNDDYTLTLIP